MTFVKQMHHLGLSSNRDSPSLSHDMNAPVPIWTGPMGGTGEAKLSLVGVLWSDAIVVDAYLDPVQWAHDKLIVAWATPIYGQFCSEKHRSIVKVILQRVHLDIAMDKKQSDSVVW